MRLRLSILLLLVAWSVSFSTVRSSEPLLVIIEGSSWFGSSSPSFALYEDGTVIYQLPKELSFREHRDESWLKQASFRKGHIDNPQSFIKSMFPYRWEQLKDYYKLSDATDSNYGQIWHKGKLVTLYGDWRIQKIDPNDTFAEALEHENQLRLILPVGLRNLLTQVENYANAEDETWLPAVIAVELQAYDYAPEDSIVWPSDFPPLQNFRYEGDNGWYSASLDIPAKLLPRFIDLLLDRKPRGAILIGGKKFALSGIQFPFPGEKTWQREIIAFQAAKREAELRAIQALPADERKQWLGQ